MSDMALDTLTRVKPKKKVEKPSLYKVVVMNDDYTPMDFVIIVLKEVFGKTTEEATELMFEIHNRGLAIAGIYSYEIAETKATQVIRFAQSNQHPLQCKIEKE